MIRFACPTCATALHGEDSDAGSKVTCFQCGQRVLVPAPDSKPADNQPTRSASPGEQPTLLPPIPLDELHRPRPPREPQHLPSDPSPFDIQLEKRPPPLPPPPPRQPEPIPPRIPAREYDDYDHDDEPPPRRSRRRDDEDDYDERRPRPRRRQRDNSGYTGDTGPGGAAVTGLVLSCIGAFFALLVPFSCGATLNLGLPLSVAGFITSLCGRESPTRTLGVVFGAIGCGMSLLMFFALAGAIARR